MESPKEPSMPNNAEDVIKKQLPKISSSMQDLKKSSENVVKILEDYSKDMHTFTKGLCKMLNTSLLMAPDTFPIPSFSKRIPKINLESSKFAAASSSSGSGAPIAKPLPSSVGDPKSLSLKKLEGNEKDEDLNFSRDIVGHFSKEISDTFEDMTTFFGFNFGKHFKDGIVKLFKGQGVLGGMLSKVFSPISKGVGKLFSPIKKMFSNKKENEKKESKSDYSKINEEILELEKRLENENLSSDERIKLNAEIFDLNKKRKSAIERIFALRIEEEKLLEKELQQERARLQNEFKTSKDPKVAQELKFSQILLVDQMKKRREIENKLNEIKNTQIKTLNLKEVGKEFENLDTDDILKLETGTQGVLGSLFADFGEGTPAILHGKEAVIPEDSPTGKLLKAFQGEVGEAKGLGISNIEMSPPQDSNSTVSSETAESYSDRVLELLESIKDETVFGFESILKPLKDIQKHFKEDSDRNEQLKDAESSRLRLLGRMGGKGDTGIMSSMTSSILKGPKRKGGGPKDKGGLIPEIIKEGIGTVLGTVLGGLGLAGLKKWWKKFFTKQSLKSGAKTVTLAKLAHTASKVGQKGAEQLAQTAAKNTAATAAKTTAATAAKTAAATAAKTTATGAKLAHTASKVGQKGAEQLAQTAAKTTAATAAKTTAATGAKISKKALEKMTEDGVEKLAQTAAKTTAATAAKTTTATAAKTAAATGAKTATKFGLKATIGKIPVLSALLGLGLGGMRLAEGDKAGALGEVVSGVLASMPGIGTAGSFAIDAALLGSDLHKISNLEETVKGNENIQRRSMNYEKLKDNMEYLPTVLQKRYADDPSKIGEDIRSGKLTKKGNQLFRTIDLEKNVIDPSSLSQSVVPVTTNQAMLSNPMFKQASNDNMLISNNQNTNVVNNNTSAPTTIISTNSDSDSGPKKFRDNY